jgi:hypothetical protein
MSEEFVKAELGSNTFISTDKLIYYESKSGNFVNLFDLTKNNQDFLLTTKITDENNQFLGKLNKNNFVPTTDKSLLIGRKFETKRIPNEFWLKDGDKVLVSVKASNDDWIINGIFHVQVGKSKKIVRIEIRDTETAIFERVKQVNPVTEDDISIFKDIVTFSNNIITGRGGIKISSSKKDGKETKEGLDILFGFSNNENKELSLKPTIQIKI